MRFDKIIRTGQQILNSEQGRNATRKVADTAFSAARKAAPKQAANIDRAQRAADSYLGRQGRTETTGTTVNTDSTGTTGRNSTIFPDTPTTPNTPEEPNTPNAR